MKIKNIYYSLLVGSALLVGTTSCDNDKFLTVDHYSILDLNSGYDTDAHVLRSLNGCYDSMLPSEDNEGLNADPFKPYIFTGCHPTMDTQATGWDKDFMTQSWTAAKTELKDGWSHAYSGISRCNDFLDNLSKNVGNLSAEVAATAEGEARVVRAFHYFWLATTFGRVPMLATGETYVNTPYKERAKTYEEMWNFIIDDLEAAAALLAWKPYKNQYGRCTKGMALAYLGDAYMWKAYRCPNEANDCYRKAETALKQVLDSGEYELNKSYTTLWDATGVWGKESIYEQVLNEGDKWDNWDGNSVSGANGWTIYYSAAPANGGWGTIALSWELYDSFEPGDKRRDGSLVTASVPENKLVKPEWKSTIPVQQEWLDKPQNAGYLDKVLASPNGYNPFVQQYVNYDNYKFDTGGEYAPAVYTTKYWRLGRCHWSGDQWAPAQIYRKRLPNVMLDYAECRFILYGESDADGWAQINKLRQRAFGNLEVGNADALTSTYLPYYNDQMARFYQDQGGFGHYVTSNSYPIPFATETVSVPDAQTYYAQLKGQKGFSSPVWKVALNMERRKEFSAEWSLCPDMLKSGFMKEHVDVNYPKHAQASDPLSDWQTVRAFDFDDRRMDMPIPADELIKNPLCDQNDAYK
ncbi:RagB/SusD family nutrient uptake outer membrane protein [Bacteroides sp. OttesenSCG-928-D19]|nr:RagB/SusD family nutrient uptake outer membrane protein [Bacteroides sp. OttesenSCG-928-N06]MDL2305801.1 RagB/SusD family nutrient uptake outer membrane protein [Bacteroides sp. OttesenSCG-928-D19]